MYAQAVLDTVRAHPGVRSANLNYPLSRVVVEIDPAQASLRDLCRLLNETEKRYSPSRSVGKRVPPPSLPGDTPDDADGEDQQDHRHEVADQRDTGEPPRPFGLTLARPGMGRRMRQGARDCHGRPREW